MQFSCNVICMSAILFNAGCGSGGGDRKPTHKVTGKITLAGGPVAEASVTFSPQEGQPAAFGRTDSSGAYTLSTYSSGDGAVAGKYTVLVSKGGAAPTSSGPPTHEQIASGAVNPAASHSGKGKQATASSGSLLPEKYLSLSTSDLTGEVKSMWSKLSCC